MIILLPRYRFSGWSLPQLIITILLLGILIATILPLYQQWIKQAHLSDASSALLTNSHSLEHNYRQIRSFQTKKKNWPELPVTQTKYFCIRPQGNPRYARAERFTLKAVAFDTQKEPRILKLTQDGTMLICQSSLSRCDDENTFFRGGSNIDQQCQFYHR